MVESFFQEVSSSRYEKSRLKRYPVVTETLRIRGEVAAGFVDNCLVWVFHQNFAVVKYGGGSACRLDLVGFQGRKSSRGKDLTSFRSQRDCDRSVSLHVHFSRSDLFWWKLQLPVCLFKIIPNQSTVISHDCRRRVKNIQALRIVHISKYKNLESMLLFHSVDNE